MFHHLSKRLVSLAALSALSALPLLASAAELNLYSARHYQTDEALYANFTRATGIKINRIEAGDEQIMERLRNEGANSPADVVLLVDIARLHRAEQEGLLQPVKSTSLEQRIPAHLRADNGSWYAFSTRARVIFYNKDKIKPAQVDTYEKLADPSLKGKICSRSGSHPYNLSLLSSIIGHAGEPAAEAWTRGVVANLARAPKGGDTDQIRAVAAGECDVAISNTYYFVRLMRSDKPEDKAVVQKVGMVWPNQQNRGTHLNVSGGGVAKHARNREAAVRFLEYLASDEAQRYFAAGNNEWPTVPSVATGNPELDSLGKFKVDTQKVSEVARHQATAQKVLDRAGFR